MSSADKEGLNLETVLIASGFGMESFRSWVPQLVRRSHVSGVSIRDAIGPIWNGHSSSGVSCH